MIGRALKLPLCLACALGALACDGAEDPPPEPPAGYTIEPPPLADRPIDALLAGRFAGFGDYAGIGGRAQLVRRGDGTTEVQLYVDGLAPGVEYGAHVHAFPCAISLGGPHYKLDPTVDGVSADNEIWPVLVADEYGVGRGAVATPHAARGDAQSVVIHDPMANSAEMACADLRAPGSDTWSATGGFAPFASASVADGTIGGSATIEVTPGGTRIELDVSGLRPDQGYGAHVHALPCHVADAGGHYKIDPTIAETLAENELWPAVTPGPDGRATAVLDSPHAARASAQSIVIHRQAGGAAPKVGCATLVRRDFGPLETRGRSVLLRAGVEQGYGGLMGEGQLIRRLDGTTQGLIGIQGARSGQRYPVHLHTYSCAVQAGGGHYKIDPGIEGAVETNELWLDIETDASGDGLQSATLPVLVRPEGTSMVIHDYGEGGARIACIELD